MDDRKLNRRQLLKAAGALGAAAAVLDPTRVLADEEGGQGRVTWDIVTVGPGGASRGGEASAFSEDGSRITVTGHGTFPNADRCSHDVTGGGTWKITAVSSDPRCFRGSGKYRVIELLSWHPAPGGTLPIPDNTNDKGSVSAGLVTLRLLFDNGHRGTLTVSCDLPGAPGCMFEGITASMVYEDFWNHDKGGFTLFHVSGNGNGD
jgi:hypothetical protein